MGLSISSADDIDVQKDIQKIEEKYKKFSDKIEKVIKEGVGQQTNTKKPETFIKNLKGIHAAVEFTALLGIGWSQGVTSNPSMKVIELLKEKYDKTDKCDKEIYVRTHKLKDAGLTIESMPYVDDYIFNELQLSNKEMAKRVMEKLLDELSRVYDCYESQKLIRYFIVSVIFLSRNFSDDSDTAMDKNSHVLTIGADFNLVKSCKIF